MISSPQLDEAIQILVTHPDEIRIKKLLIFACTQTWESNPSRVNDANLHQLIPALLTIAPTVERLQTYLIGVAQSLNKATEYTAIAQQVIAALSLIVSEPAPVDSPAQQAYPVIATLLQADPQSLRIKKLLILVTQKQWVSDRQQLDAMDWLALVKTVHLLAPTQDYLHQVLTSRVSKLSKAAEYTLIAERIIQEFCICYAANPPQVEPTPEASDPDATELLTQLNTQPAASSTLQTVPTSGNPSQLELRSVSLPSSKSSRGLDLFDLRLSLMRYTNPFRAKVLLFSLLHEPFQYTPEHRSMIRNHELDELLKLSIQTHRTVNDLETDLIKTVTLLDESDEYQQVARFIIEMVKPIYISQSLEQNTSQPNLDSGTNFLQTFVSQGNATQPEQSQLP
ncbi:hypothetical protein [Egbenema bharatensis]|uniref:hypothetical protein n=1 Tax=Egbenema bharatensis TaxID=3463334 RepID=UPI003A8BCBD4